MITVSITALNPLSRFRGSTSDLISLFYQTILGYGLTETSPAVMLCPRKNCKPGAVGVMLPNIEGKVSGNGNIAYCCSPHQALLSMITLKKCYEYYFKAGYFLSQNSRLLVETLI